MAGIAALLAATASASAATFEARVQSTSGEALGDAVVVAVPQFAHRMPAPKPASVEQSGKEFTPRVKVVMVGTPVSFPNRDETKHHVYSFSAAKKFEIELYKGTPGAPVTFDQPGEVILGCNIHDWMIGYLYVSESPHFAITDASGRAQITGLPPGNYIVRVWHPAALTADHQSARGVAVGEPGAQATWQLRVRPEERIRRAPAAGGSTYR
jgi:plastocyanin